jgi:S1-C subfamily serine protease
MIADVVARVRSGVVHLNFYRAGQRISAGTGFILRNHLVTNNHVYSCPGAEEVVVRLHDSDPDDPRDGIRIDYLTLQSRLETGAPEASYDYAVFSIPELMRRGLYSFDFEHLTPLQLGREYAILGFPLDHRNLTVHRGIASSFYTRNGVSIIQLDASVNNGNSGGPLVELTDGGVVGIVTRKATGLSDVFAQLKTTIQGNIEVIQQAAQSGARVVLAGIDPNQAMLAGQQQLMNLCSQIERSANTGIGYAFSIEHLAQESLFQPE